MMVKRRISGEICYSVNRYGEANSKYMKMFNKNRDSLYIMSVDKNNLQCQKIPKNHI